MSAGRSNIEQTVKEDRKALVAEAKRQRQQVKELQAKLLQYKQRNAKHRTHVLALLQANRMLADLVKAYADREAVMMATVRTFHQAFEPGPDSDVVDLDADG